MSEVSGELPPRYAAVIGINKYVHNAKLRSAVPDALAVAAALKRHGYTEVIVLDDEKATIDGIGVLLETTLPALLGKKIPGEKLSNAGLVLYFAGHGKAFDNEKKPEGYLIPQDASGTDRETWLSMDELRTALDELACRHLLVVLDCCYAGSFRWATASRTTELEEFWLYDSQYDHFLEGEAWQVMTSASHDQLAADLIQNNRDQEGWEVHSPFADAFLKGLAGKADWSNEEHESDGVITATEFYLYIRQKLWRDGLRQTPGLWPLKPENTGEYIFLNPSREKNTRADPPLDDANNPWLGLEAYGEGDASLLFGRERVVREILDRLPKLPPASQGERVDSSRPPGGQDPDPPGAPPPRPLLVVVGPSGSGKSSVVRAGVLPRLEEPSEELAEAIGKWTVVRMPRLEGDPGPLLTEAGKRLDEAPHGRRKLLFIDQFEELFTTCRDEAARSSFLDRLRSLLSSGDPEQADAAPADPVWVLLTLRSDFESLASQALGDLTRERYELPVDLELRELREIIAAPATRKALYFEPAELVDKLAGEVFGAPGQLALLSFTLAEMYREARGRRLKPGISDRALTPQDYDEVGGVEGAVKRLVGKVLEEAQREGLESTVRRVALRMVEFEGWSLSRRRVSYRELEYADPQQQKQKQVEKVIRWLTEARLVVVDEDHLELAHDTLVQGWPLRAAETQLTLRAAWEAAEEWDARQRAGAWLWADNPRLQLVQAERQKLNRLEREFVDASVRRKREQDDARRAAVAGIWMSKDPTLAALVLREVENPDETPRAVASMLGSLMQPIAHSILRGHGDAVVAAAFNTDGTQVVTASRDETARVWHVWVPPGGGQEDRTASRPMVLRGHRGEIVSAAWNVDGSRVLTAGGDGTARLWNLADHGREVVLGHRNVTGAAWNADSSKILTAGGNTAQVWNDDGSGPPVVLEHDSPVETAVWIADGTQIFTFSQNGNAHLWNADGSGSTVLKSDQDDWQIGSATAFNADGTQLVSICSDGAARILSTVDRRLGEPIVLRHDEWITSAAFSADGTKVVTASYDGTAKVWLADGPQGGAPAEPIALLQHEAWVVNAAFSADGTQVVTASYDGTALVWDANAVGQPIVLRGHRARVLSSAFNADGTEIVTTSGDGTARLWKVSGRCGRTPVGRTPAGRTPAMPIVLREHEQAVLSAVFNADGTQFVTASEDGTARVFQLDGPGGRRRQAKLVLEGHQGPVNSAVWNAGGTHIVTASCDGTARVFQLDGPGGRRRQAKLVLEGHEDWVRSAAWNADGSQVVTASDDRTARIFQVDGPGGRRRQAKLVLEGHEDSVWSAAWNAGGTHIVTASWDRTARIFQVNGLGGRRRQAKVVLDGYTDPVVDAAFNPAGTQVVTASWDGTARIYNADGSGEVVLPHETATLPALFNKAVMSAAWNADGTRVVTACVDGAVRVWKANGSGTPQVLRGHLYEVESAAFNAAGTQVLSASYDGTARVWTLDGSREPVILRHHEEKSYLIAAWNAAGTRVVTAGCDGTVRLWTIDAARLQDAIRAVTPACLDPEFRMNFLGESRVEAWKKYAECELSHGRCPEAWVFDPTDPESAEPFLSRLPEEARKKYEECRQERRKR